MPNRIGIIAAGAIGCVVGGLLTKAGHDVTLIDQWPEHVEAMRQQGLRLSGTIDDVTVKVRALHIHEAQRLTEPFDAAFVAVKSYNTEWATAPTPLNDAIVPAVKRFPVGAITSQPVNLEPLLKLL